MAEILLLEETAFTSAVNPPYGYSYIVMDAPFVLEVGAEYRAVFDGTEYPCVGLDASSLGTGAVGIGNGAAFGLPGSGEPFCFGTFGGAAIVVCLLDTEPTQHSITVYKTVKESGLVTENYDGSQIVHPGVETVSLYNTEGGIETFVHDSLVAEPVEATVDVDWSGGDMVVTPEEGQVFSRLLIPRPEDAMQENILEGKNIGGILGTLVAGGGGNGIVMASGAVPKGDSDGIATIEHNLGVIPDIVFVYCGVPSGTGNNTLYMAIGFSTAFSSKLSTTYKYTTIHVAKSNYVRGVGYAEEWGIETFARGAHIVSAATETTVAVGTKTDKISTSTIGSWIAIGGLT